MFRRIIFISAILLSYRTIMAGPDTTHLRVSLLTCSPGNELYSTFGHSALRIIDSSTGTDVVYNYGVFDFQDPDFYLKFVRGKLMYFLDQDAYPYFEYAYAMEGRKITEQVLRLDAGRKTQIRSFLYENLMPENRFYKYDFLYDNCTTRLRDLILTQSGSGIQTASVLTDSTLTFRDQIHAYLYRNEKYWAALGIDILLGSRIDRPMNNMEVMFLPDYLEKALDSSRDQTGPVVAEKKVILSPSENLGSEPGTIPHTIIFFSAILAVMVFMKYLRSGFGEMFLATGDALLFSLTGIIGIVVVFMWTATDHQSCRDNFNLIWAVPTHLIAAFRLRSGNAWVKRYLRWNAWLCGILLLAWFFLPQSLNPAIIPVVIWMGWRSYERSA